MIYARAHDQTVAEDYFTAMQRVEQRLSIEPEPVQEIVKVQKEQLLFWVERLSQPELCPTERMDIAENLKRALVASYTVQHSPPQAVAV
jgi:hypothetical protein